MVSQTGVYSTLTAQEGRDRGRYQGSVISRGGRGRRERIQVKEGTVYHGILSERQRQNFCTAINFMWLNVCRLGCSFLNNL